MIRMIAAVSSNGIIGKDGKLPFHYSEDLKWFKQCTLDSVIIMGRKTFESIGKPLPKRENVIISNTVQVIGTQTSKSLADYFQSEKYRLRDKAVDYWLIGGSSIYQDGMFWADEIYLTLIPDVIEGNNLVKFPWINPTKFKVEKTYQMSELIGSESKLKVVKYIKI